MSAADTLATPARGPAIGRDAAPRISIAMPVYNGAATVGQAIESLLAQTQADFELIVSDNASTDGTGDVVQAYARQDGRIRYTRQSQNIGGPGNYSFVARAARGEYVKWAAAADWCAPTLLERCLEAIVARPDAVLAAPRTRLFASEITAAEDYARDIEILDERPVDRLRRQISEMQLNNAMNGLIRTSALRRTRLIEAYCHSDMVLMGRLALQGKFLLVDERLLYRRMEKSSATSLQSPMERLRFYYPKMNARSLFQNWKLHAGWLRAVAAASLPFEQRREALALVARRCYWQWPALVDDLRDAWRYLTGSREAVVRPWPLAAEDKRASACTRASGSWFDRRQKYWPRSIATPVSKDSRSNPRCSPTADSACAWLNRRTRPVTPCARQVAAGCAMRSTWKVRAVMAHCTAAARPIVCSSGRKPGCAERTNAPQRALRSRSHRAVRKNWL